jgi:branched-chain amino acid aminotransferase
MKVYIDGQLLPQEQACISVFDHGLLYGDGVFEGIRFYNGRVFRCEEHMDRLFDSAKAILLDPPMEKEAIAQAMLETIRANDLRDGYVRLVLTRGAGSLGLSPFLCPKASLIIIAAGIQLYKKESYENGLVVVTTGTRRNSPAALSPAVKSLNYLNNVMAKVEAIQAGAEEGLMLNNEGYVAECTGDNVFVVKKGIIYTPPVSAGSLDGITRQAVIQIAEELGIPLIERNMTRYDIYTADEFFLTGTAAEVIPAVELDKRSIGDGKPGPITKKLIARFHEVAQSTGREIYV